MRKTRNWKHVTKTKKQYGTRETAKYETPFLVLDPVYLVDEDEDTTE